MDHPCFKDKPRDLWEEIDGVGRAKHNRLKAGQLVQSRAPWNLRLGGVLWSQEEAESNGRGSAMKSTRKFGIGGQVWQVLTGELRRKQ